MKRNHGLWRWLGLIFVLSLPLVVTPGDIVFAGGALMLAWYALRLLRRPAGHRAPAGAVTAAAQS